MAVSDIAIQQAFPLFLGLVAGLLVAFEFSNKTQIASLRKILDKAQWTARPRALARLLLTATAMVLVGWWPMVVAFVGVVLVSHSAASFVRVKLDRMHGARPVRPSKNLKTVESYKKVWGSLTDHRRRKVALLYSADVVLLLPFLATAVVREFDLVVPLILTAAEVAFIIGAVAFLAFIVFRVNRNSEAFFDKDVPGKIERRTVKELKAYKPEIVVYFAGSSADRYQLDQWIGPINALKRRVLFVVREETHLSGFPKTQFPVVAARTVRQLETAVVPSIRLALYVSNAAKNSHLVRNDQLVHAYLNHGDSDKTSSANPLSRAFDVLFVAGELGIERYRRVGFDAKSPAIEMVGRPQLQGLKARKIDPKKQATLLYAPTWEGLVDSADYSSITSLGIDLVNAAAAHGDAKLVVRPHPSTGRYSKKHKESVAAIKKLAASHDLIEMDTEKELLKSLAKADVLISDVSAVVSDFLATGRPIIISKPPKMADKAFCQKFPIGNAAVLVPSDDGEKAFTLAFEALSKDIRAAKRKDYSERVLGYHPKGPQATFGQAIDDLLVSPKKAPKAPAPPARKETVLITLDSLRRRGAERDVVELSSELADRGHVVRVFAFDGELRDELDPRVHFIKRPSNIVAEALALRRECSQATIVNTHNIRSLAVLAALGCKTPIQATVHNLASDKHLRVVRWLLENKTSSVTFVSSTAQKKLFAEAEVGTTIHHGLGISIPSRHSSLRPQKNLVVFLGHLSEEKGPDYAVRAMAFLPKHRLRIVGDGPLREELEMLSRDLGVEERVTFAGETGEPLRELSRASVVLSPSRQDSLPRTVREAAALGRPIVGADIEGIIEAAGDYKLITFVDPTDSQAVAAAVEKSADVTDRLLRPSTIRKAQPTSDWHPFIAALEELGNQPTNQAETKHDKKSKANAGLVANDQTNADGKSRQDRYLDRMNEVAREQRERSLEAPSLVRGNDQQHNPDETGNNTEPNSSSASKNVDIDLVDPDKNEPASNEWFDDKMGEHIELTPSFGSPLMPPSDLPVGTIAEEIDLTKDDGEQSPEEIIRVDGQDGPDTGERHQGSDEIWIDGGSTQMPGQPGGEPASVQPSGPVLTALLERQDDRPVVAERDIDISNSRAPFAHSAPVPDSSTNAPKTIRKANDGVVASVFAAPLAGKHLDQLIDNKITPNQVTVAATAISLLGSWFIGGHTLTSRFLGLGLYQYGFVLDCADGQLARATNTESAFGEVFDELSDRISELYLINRMSQVAQISTAPTTAKAAMSLMVARHLLSRLLHTKQRAVATDATDATVTSQSKTNQYLRSASNLTIGDRLGLVTLAALRSPNLGLQMHASLGAIGLARDLASKQINGVSPVQPSQLAALAATAIGLGGSSRLAPMSRAIGTYCVLAGAKPAIKSPSRATTPKKANTPTEGGADGSVRQPSPGKESS